MVIVSHSVSETEDAGQRLGKALAGGEVVAFRGGLGMGKTAFTRGLARGLGSKIALLYSPQYIFYPAWINSPLFRRHFQSQ